MNKLLRLFKEIKLAIKLRSLYVNKAFISHSDVLGWNLGYYSANVRGKLLKKTREDDIKGMRIIFQDCIGKRINRLLKYEKDQCRFGWVIWYV